MTDNTKIAAFFASRSLYAGRRGRKSPRGIARLVAEALLGGRRTPERQDLARAIEADLGMVTGKVKALPPRRARRHLPNGAQCDYINDLNPAKERIVKNTAAKQEPKEPKKKDAMGQRLDDQEAAFNYARDLFETEHPTFEMFEGVHDIVLGWEEKKAQKLAFQELKQAKERAVDLLGIEGKKTEAVFWFYDDLFASEDEDDEEEK